MDHIIKLIRRCKNNDKGAFNDLLRKHENYLYQLCYGLTRDKDEALDIMQETYIKVFRTMHRFDENRPFLPWLKKIAINTFLNHRRGFSEEPHLSLEAHREDSYRMTETLAGKENTEETALLSSTRDVIDTLLRELPPNYRAALILRYMEEMSYEEIARTLDQPLGTVKSSIFRARNILRKKMEKDRLLEV